MTNKILDDLNRVSRRDEEVDIVDRLLCAPVAARDLGPKTVGVLLQLGENLLHRSDDISEPETLRIELAEGNRLENLLRRLLTKPG